MELENCIVCFEPFRKLQCPQVACVYPLLMWDEVLSHDKIEARRLQEEEERRQREEEERRAQEERERLQAIEDARFAKETAALEVWLVHQKDCFDEWKAEQWKDMQVRMYTHFFYMMLSSHLSSSIPMSFESCLFISLHLYFRFHCTVQCCSDHPNRTL